MHSTAEISVDTHGQFDQLERIISQMPKAELQLVHHFSDGVYGRELRIPKHTILTGKIHRGRTLNIISKGKILVNAIGEEPRMIEAPCIFVSEPGTRRAGVAMEDTIWICVHANPDDAQDLGLLEERLIEPHTNRLMEITKQEELR